MTIRMSAAHNAARLAGTLAFLDSGAGNARVWIFEGARPASAEDPPTSTLLVEIELTKPAGTISGGLLSLTQAADGLIAQTGVATWARIVNGDAQTAFDADVGQGAGPWEVELPQTQLFAGGGARLVSCVLG